MSPAPVEPVVRAGPMCGTCTSAGTPTVCTDCYLRSGLHTQAFPPPAAAMLPAATPRWPVALIAGCLVTAFVLGSLLTGVDRTVFGAKHAVTDFFAALQRRDADAAIALIDHPLGIVTTSSMLHNAGYQPPSSWTVSKIKGGFRSAIAEVSYTVDGARLEQTFSLTRVGYRSGVFSHWKITGQADPLPSINVLIPDTGILLAGEKVSPQTSLRSGRVLPGSYLVTVPPNPLLTLNQQVIARPDQAQDPDESPVMAEVSSTAGAKLRSAVKTELRNCAESTDAAPANCPLVAQPQCTTTAGSASWKITKFPALTLVQQAASDLGDPGGSNSVLTTRTKHTGRATFNAYCYDSYTGTNYAVPQTVVISMDGWTVASAGQSVLLLSPSVS
jgi:hypothetical protein